MLTYRRRAQALQQKKACAADLADHGVLDVHTSSKVEAWLGQGALQRHILPCDPSLAGSLQTASVHFSGASASSGRVGSDPAHLVLAQAGQPTNLPSNGGSSRQPGVLAYTLPAHPGFVLLPALLPVAHQLQLMCDALTRYTRFACSGDRRAL